jgi:hypothetical protein
VKAKSAIRWSSGRAVAASLKSAYDDMARLAPRLEITKLISTSHRAVASIMVMQRCLGSYIHVSSLWTQRLSKLRSCDALGFARNRTLFQCFILGLTKSMNLER